MKLALHTLLLSALFEPSLSSNLRRKLSFFDESCTAVVGVVEYEDEDDETFLACETPSGKTFKLRNIPKPWIDDKISIGELKSGRTFLDIPDGTEVDEETQEIKTRVPPGLVNRPEKERRLAVTAGTKTVLVVRVIASDGQTGFSEAALSNSVFGNAGDPVNLKSQYFACSHEKLDFVEAPDRTGISAGAVTVNLPNVSTSEGDAVMRNAITNELNSRFGVSSPTALANHVMYCLPPNTMSGIAYAYINSWNSVYSNQWCTYVSAQMHELGHNLNLAHSNEGGQTYADQSGMMGYSYGSSDTPEMCFNAAKSWQFDWYNNRKWTLDAFTDTSYQGPLASIVDNPDAAGPPMLIKLNTSTGNDYFITFNSKTGFNVGTQEGGNQVLVVTTGSEGRGYSESSLLAKMSAGGTYSISNFDGSGQAFTITVNSIDLTNRNADVSICLGSCPTGCTADSECDDGIYCNGMEICGTGGTCQAGSPIVCDNGLFCDGLETCNEATQSCDPGTPPSCDDGLYCNGVEVCSNSNERCEPGEPVICDNGLFCDGVETCNETTQSCDAGTPPVCDDGNPCNGVETCNSITNQCESGVTIQCDSVETCSLCPNECTSPFGGAVCGNGLCEETEDCLNCAADCNGKTGGKKNTRFCCSGGPGNCLDSRCNGSGFSCSTDPVGQNDVSCCGDGICEGTETFSTCAADCEAPAPTPATSSPTKSPVSSCPFCEPSGGPCCGTCISSGKPSGRGCF